MLDRPWCHWCKRKFDKPLAAYRGLHATKQPTLEHIVPRCLGGTHNYSNLALACFYCNNDRGNQYANKVFT